MAIVGFLFILLLIWLHFRSLSRQNESYCLFAAAVITWLVFPVNIGENMTIMLLYLYLYGELMYIKWKLDLREERIRKRIFWIDGISSAVVIAFLIVALFPGVANVFREVFESEMHPTEAVVEEPVQKPEEPDLFPLTLSREYAREYTSMEEFAEYLAAFLKDIYGEDLSIDTSRYDAEKYSVTVNSTLKAMINGCTFQSYRIAEEGVIPYELSEVTLARYLRFSLVEPNSEKMFEEMYCACYYRYGESSADYITFLIQICNAWAPDVLEKELPAFLQKNFYYPSGKAYTKLYSDDKEKFEAADVLIRLSGENKNCRDLYNKTKTDIEKAAADYKKEQERKEQEWAEEDDWEKENSGSSSSSKKSDSKKEEKKYDPYDVYDFDDADDFADHWADEFGDGDYEDGWDDAFMYWEDHH